jgi:hypothetical protein
MALQARLAASKAGNRRSSPRRTLHLQSTLADGGEEVIIHDISHTGLLLETTALLTERQALDVELPEVGIVQANVVWRSSRFVGCRFATPVSQAAVSAALLRNPIARPEETSEERAWERLGELCDVPESARDPNALPIAAKVSIVAGSSVLIWVLILRGFGIV